MQKPSTPIPLPLLVTAGSLLFSASHAEAHHAEFMSNAPFLQGLSMPLHGIDHLLSAVAVGLVASHTNRRRTLAIVWVAYTALALAGGLLNLGGVALPEFAVPLTVAATGLLLCRGARTGWGPFALASASAALCHGDALLKQTVTGTDWSLFATGCLSTTLLICGTALLAGRCLAEARLRLAGAGLVAGTALLALFPNLNEILIQLLEGAR